MNLREAKAIYEAGEVGLQDLANASGTTRHSLRKMLEGEGVEIRPRGGTPDEPHVPPTPRPCANGCGRPVTSIGSQTCLPCALHPPCRCTKAIGSGAFYGGQESCRRCGNLMQKGR